jgi:hypothetical protein
MTPPQDASEQTSASAVSAPLNQANRDMIAVYP